MREKLFFFFWVVIVAGCFFGTLACKQNQKSVLKEKDRRETPIVVPSESKIDSKVDTTIPEIPGPGGSPGVMGSGGSIPPIDIMPTPNSPIPRRDGLNPPTGFPQ